MGHNPEQPAGSGGVLPMTTDQKVKDSSPFGRRLGGARSATPLALSLLPSQLDSCTTSIGRNLRAEEEP